MKINLCSLLGSLIFNNDRMGWKIGGWVYIVSPFDFLFVKPHFYNVYLPLFWQCSIFSCLFLFLGKLIDAQNHLIFAVADAWKHHKLRRSLGTNITYRNNKITSWRKIKNIILCFHLQNVKLWLYPSLFASSCDFDHY